MTLTHTYNGSGVQNVKFIPYGVHLRDDETGVITRVDVVEVREGVEPVLADYLQGVEDNWLKRNLKPESTTFVKLDPNCARFTVPVTVPPEGLPDMHF